MGPGARTRRLRPPCSTGNTDHDLRQCLGSQHRPGRLRGGLSHAGIRVSIDDFGQGRTSLGHLADLPVDELKIDRSFVTGMCSAPAHTAIVQSVIELGHNLSMRVVAGGVESAEELLLLDELGCDVAQGYYLGRPASRETLAERLHAAVQADATHP